MEEKNEKFKSGFVGSNYEMSYDGNEDGQDSAVLKLNLAEVLDELKDYGSAKIEASSIKLKMRDNKILILVDTNKDGVEVLSLEIDLAEAMDEAI